jgi:hypothetical protein
MRDRLRRLVYGKRYGYRVLFCGQDRRVVGKPGVILGEIGMPEDYEFGFYRRYMEHVFAYVLPFFVRPLVLADRGRALIDPENPLAREEFTPRQLIDCEGSFTNRDGVPYAECEVVWKGPGMRGSPSDHGYFLYRGDGPSGAPDICGKTGAKVSGWYYGKLLPEGRIPWRSQMRAVYDEATARLASEHPDAEHRLAYYTDSESMRDAVEALLAAGCETIVYQCISNPLYGDFEDYGYALPLVHDLVDGRAKVVCADQLGSRPSMRQAYLELVRDRLAEIPGGASVCVLLSAHGHPFKNDTMDRRASEYRDPLTEGTQALLRQRRGRTDVVWTFDEYSDEYWDPKGERLSTRDAYLWAIEEGFEYVVEVPTEAPAENTDQMFLHAMKKFDVFSDYGCYDPVPYPDWSKPLVRRFHERNTTLIYASCPVGPYRRHIVDAIVESVGEVLRQRS